MKTALTIAGSDSSGGAGIQADIKTMTANGVYAMSAITALTAQNTTGVYGIMEATPEFLAEQLDAGVHRHLPRRCQNRHGFLFRSHRRHRARSCGGYQAKNIVVDPVMVSTSGSRLLAEDAVAALTEELLPLCHGVHPQHSGSPGAGRYGRHLPGGNGAGRPAHRRKIWLCCFVQRRPSGERPPTITCCAEWKGHLDCGASGLKTPTPTAPAALCPAPLPQTWPKAMTCLRRWSGPRPIFPGRWPLCWIWDLGAARWTISSI